MSNKLIIKNTFILYIQIVVNIIVSFLSVRYILDNLGIIDYGIFTVVAGLLGMLMFLSNAMNASAQRFLSFELGKNNFDGVKAHFNGSISIYILLSFIIIVFALLFEDLIFESLLTIPKERLSATIIVYKFVIVNFVITLLSTPFNAVLNAREKMSILAIISILHTFSILGVSLSLYWVNGDKLIFYAVSYSVVSFILFLVLVVSTKVMYMESSFEIKRMLNITIIKKQLSFSGWSLFGGVAGIAQNQGLNVLLNIYFGPAMNAAFGLAQQVAAKINMFSQTLTNATRPQIIKAESIGDRDRLHTLSFTSSRYSFFIFSLFAVPLFMELPYILELWLVNVPEYTVEFCRLMIIIGFVNQSTIGLISAMLASGRIALYQSVLGSILMSILPLGYFLLKNGYPPESILLVGVVLAVIAGIARVVFVQKYVGMNIVEWLKRVPFKIAIGVFPAVMISTYLLQYIELGFQKLIITFIVTSILIVLNVLLFGMYESEKKMLKNIYVKSKKKVFN